mmetsp:Transcript_27245/g.68740  ORF Transcript_27245/g.68740 Transcript_27245/m.68740 type:complete len:140 (-) Transcript_27245:156-575(-)|eukprot:CAMPEP_0179010138 /NCGR_PEP_ID=MMETSP0795-20121207/16642_1 /TAXON_ID=88552 /ORGANISM="Amoebophrya sp., Strain Ameob2" /LENGTH=139 /DNA_ID=CAMNT_0020705375 /DNA_START=147 /DNA_END=566 /DNA_ORIENTATION=-
MPFFSKKSSLAARAAFLTALATVLPVVQARFDVWRDGVLYECDDWVNPWNVDPRFHPGCRRYSSWRRMIGLWVSLIVFFVILAIFFPIYCCVRSNQADVVVIEEQPVVYTHAPAAPVVYQQQPGVQVVYAGESDSDYEV